VDVRDLGGRTAVVTGAASGIGRATALLLARRGADVALCDLQEEALAGTAGEIEALGRRALARTADVSSAEAMQAFADAVHDWSPGVDLLVNNAGVGLAASFRDTTLEDWRWIVDVNLMGVVHGCHVFVPPMVERGAGGHVVNVSSAAGYAASEALCAYATTKFGVLGLSEALRSELARFGIGVTALCPGLIDTPITRSARTRGVYARPEAVERAAEVYRRRGYGPERVARNLLRAVQRNRAVAPVSPEAWVLYGLKRALPGLLAGLARWGQRRQRRELEALPPS